MCESGAKGMPVMAATTASELSLGEVGDGAETRLPAFGNRVALSEIPWDLYLALRAGATNHHLRMTYDLGSLEIVSPSYRHESQSELLGRFVEVFTEERGLPLRAAGSTTFQLPQQKIGLEPDRCYYLGHAEALHGVREIDLRRHPPPDLAIEVDVTSPSVPKLPLYAAIGVPEVWIWRGGRIEVFCLTESGAYQRRDASEQLPGFPLREAERLNSERDASDDTAIVRQFRMALRSATISPSTSPPSAEDS